jgi:hypothetical protein
MRDWREVVQSKLAGLRLVPGAKAEVIEELAAHLEEDCERLSGTGMNEELAAQKAMLQVPDWKALQRSICAAKNREDQMKDRVRQLWFPGFLTLTLSSALLMILQKQGWQPRIIFSNDLGLMLFYIPWLAALPLFGALGAYLSLRAGGSSRAMLFSGVFPVLTLVACLFVIVPFSLVIDRKIAFHFRIEGFLNALIGWVLVPGVALLVGALPVRLLAYRQSDSDRLSSAGT